MLFCLLLSRCSAGTQNQAEGAGEHSGTIPSGEGTGGGHSDMNRGEDYRIVRERVDKFFLPVKIR